MKQLFNKNQTVFLISFVITMVVIFCCSPVYQSPLYHFFAEQRTIIGIPHIGDVLSNLSFVVVGLVLLLTQTKNRIELYRGQKHIFVFFCYACLALGMGSSYYHWNPNNETLAWDRAAMVLGFSVIFFDSIVRFKILNHTHTIAKFAMINTIFLSTVIFWMVFSRLEAYVFVQFFTMFVLSILAIMNYKEIPSKHMFYLFAWYFVAKICEYEDKEIFNLTMEFVSGHTLKHFAYAASLYYFGKNMQIKEEEEKEIS